MAAWHILRYGVEYRDLGPDHLERLNHERLVRYHRRRLADRGFTVQLSPAPAERRFRRLELVAGRVR